MRISPEQREAKRTGRAVDDAINGNHAIEQIRQELENLNSSLESLTLCVQAIERNARVSSREWRIAQVEIEQLIPRCEELFAQSWILDQVLTMNPEVDITIKGPKQQPQTLVLIFWRPLGQTKSEGDKPNA